MTSLLNPRPQVPQSLLALNTRLLLNCLDGLDDTAQRRIDDRTNNAAFLGVHLVDSRFFFARALGALAESPLLNCWKSGLLRSTRPG